MPRRRAGCAGSRRGLTGTSLGRPASPSRARARAALAQGFGLRRAQRLCVRATMSMEPNRIFSAEQIEVHPELPGILKDYSKAVIRANPKDLLAFSAEYFRKTAGIPGGACRAARDGAPIPRARMTQPPPRRRGRRIRAHKQPGKEVEGSCIRYGGGAGIASRRYAAELDEISERRCRPRARGVGGGRRRRAQKLVAEPKTSIIIKKIHTQKRTHGHGRLTLRCTRRARIRPRAHRRRCRRLWSVRARPLGE